MVLLHRGTGTPASWKNATRGQTRIHCHCDEDHIVPSTWTDAAPADSLHEGLAQDRFLANPSTQPFASPNRSWVKKGAWHALTGIFFMAAGWGLGRWTAPQRVETEVFIEPSQKSWAQPDTNQGPGPEEVSKEARSRGSDATTDPASISPVEVKSAPSGTSISQPEIQASQLRSPAAQPASIASGSEKALSPGQDGEHVQTVSELKEDIMWLRDMSSDRWVVAHGSFRVLDHARKLQSEHPELARSRIVPIRLNGEPAFAVLTGPFQTQDRARTYMQRLSWSQDCKILSVGKTQRLVDMALHGLH
jgi:cell division septation protein DedD